MKQLLLIIMFAVFSFSLAARDRHFLSICGKDTTKIVWNEKDRDGMKYLKITIGSQITEYISDKDYITTWCRIKDAKKRTDITITLQDGIYSLRGILKSKSYEKTITSQGHPWLQNIAYSLANLTENKDEAIYECFRPDNMEFITMKANKGDNVEFNNKKSKEIRIRPTGLLSKIWSCRYYLDELMKEYVGYRGVNKAGAQETIIIPIVS